MKRNKMFYCLLGILWSLISAAQSAPQAYRRDPGHPTWHHGAFHDVKDSIRSEVRQMLHSRAEVPFQVPLEVNVVLIGFNGDGGYRYTIDSQKLEEFLRVGFPSHRPSCLETGQPLDIEHHVVFNAFPAGQPELIALEKALKAAMTPAGTAREADFGREVPLFEVEATAVEPEFQKLYSYLFDLEHEGFPVEEMDRPKPNAIFVVNFDKIRIDPRNKELDLDSLMYGKITNLNGEDMKKQEGDYIYRYRYNGGGASQVWLGSGRFVVIDLSAGPCTYGKIETEEGSVNPKTLPRLQNVLFPKSGAGFSEQSAHDIFVGQLAAFVATTVEHVVAPDVRYETVDMTTRLLVPIIVLQNHNRYNIMSKGHNYSIDVEAIEAEVKKMLHQGQEVVIVGGTHALHHHEKLAIAVSKAMRGHSLQETKKDGRFHVHTKTYLDGAILKEEMERSADVLAAGLLEVSDPTLSSKFFLRQTWMDDADKTGDSILKHKPLWASYTSKHRKDKRRRSEKKKQGDIYRTYGTRVVPVFVLSLADVDENLMMEDESLVWTSNDVVIVLQHQNEKIPLSYVSELERRHAIPSQAQRHILAGLASVVGGLSAPYEKASHVHERPVVNWLWAAGCHPFGPFSNTSQISQMLRDVAMIVDMAKAVKALALDDSVRVIILSGSGRAFCSGVDLTSAEDVFKGDVKDLETDPVVQMERCRKPIIGAINGLAVTAGFEIALACDLLVASKDAKFMDTHARFGIFPSWGMSQKLSRTIGASRAREVSLAAVPITAEQAKKWGLVNHVVEKSEVLKKARELAEAIIKNNQDLVLKYKSVINDGFKLDLAHALALEKERAHEYYDGMTTEQFKKMQEFIAGRNTKKTPSKL